MTVEQWRWLFAQESTNERKAVVILDNIDGYGVEYGFNVEDDADDLLNAIQALRTPDGPQEKPNGYFKR